MGITHILSIMSAEEFLQYGPDKSHGVELKHLKVQDKASEDIVQYFDAAYAWIDAALAKSGSVIVHCQQGVSRAAAFVVAYCESNRCGTTETVC